MRDRVLTLAILGALWTAAVTEILSLVHALRPGPIAFAWGVFALGVLAGWRRYPVRLSWSWPAPLEMVPIAAVGLILAVTAGTVALCPPNNWDVILYHLPRQVQWMQQAGVQHFPTQDYRLTVNPPLAELIGLHAMILSGSDRLNAAVSWGSFALSLLAVSLLARALGANRLGQWVAAATAASIPIAIHEAVSGKNDGLVAWLLAASVLQLLRLWQQPHLRWSDGGLFGATLGLLCLAKGTGAVFGLPVAALALARVAWKRPSGGRLACLTACGIAASINLPHALRNLHAYGSLVGHTFQLGNQRHDLPTLGSNLLRNLAMHLAMPSRAWNQTIEHTVRRWHGRLGWPMDAPDSTWQCSGFRLEHGIHTETATAPWHVLLACAVCAWLVIRPEQRGWLVVLVLAGGLVGFCLAFKWQPWHPRLHLPLFTLAAAGTGVIFSSRLGVLAPWVIAWLAGSSIPALLASEYRTLVGSGGLSVWRHSGEELRFHGRREVLQAAEAMVALSRDAARIDLINHTPLPWEYALTRRLKAVNNRRHVGYFYPVRGSPACPAPDGVIWLGEGPAPEWLRHSSGQVYRLVEAHYPFGLYRPHPPGAAIPPDAVLDHAVGRFGIGAEPLSYPGSLP